MSQPDTEIPNSIRRIARDAWKDWLLAGLWLALIAIESTDMLSSEHTGSALYYWLTRLFGPVNPLAFDIWHFYLRKAGHVSGYAILSYLLFRAWRATLPRFGFLWSFRWARISLSMTVLVATLDEWHQTFIPSRTGSLRDVLLDSIAGFAAQVLIWLFLRNRRVPQEGALLHREESSSNAETAANAAEK